MEKIKIFICFPMTWQVKVRAKRQVKLEDVAKKTEGLGSTDKNHWDYRHLLDSGGSKAPNNTSED